MVVSNSLMDQVLKTADASQAGMKPKTQDKKADGDGKDFDSMIRQKQQEVKTQQGKSEKPAAETQKPAAKDGKSEITDEQYAVAASMLLQPQTNLEEVDRRMDLETAPMELVHPETIPEPELGPRMNEMLNPRQVLPTEEAPVEIAPETAPAELVKAPETELPLEMEAAPAEEEHTDALPTEAAAQEQPVFGELDATPVKVSEPEEPLPLEAEDAEEQLAARIRDFVTDETGTSRMELTLTPANLGKVTVQITHGADGALHIELTASTVRAMNLLDRSASGLQAILSAGGNRPSVEVEVRTVQETPQQQQFLNPDGSSQNQQQQQQRNPQQQQQKHRPQDFIQQLRLGLVDLNGE